MMRMVSSWRTTCTTKSSRERSVYPIAPSRASSSAVASTKRKNGSKKTVLAQIDGRLLGVPNKGLPAQLKPSVHELQCIYIACTRQAAYLFVCATRKVRRRRHRWPGKCCLSCSFTQSSSRRRSSAKVCASILSWTLPDVSTKDIILTHTYSVQTAVTRRLPRRSKGLVKTCQS
jgi:hypothetical protein